MIHTPRRVTALAVLCCLVGATFTAGQGNYIAYRNPYTGTMSARGNYHNLYTGTTVSGAGAYNPYTGRAVAGRTTYNPYTGGSRAVAAGRRW